MTVKHERWPARVLVVCDGYLPARVDRHALVAQTTANGWRDGGSLVEMLTGEPLRTPEYPLGYSETEESWLEGIPVYRVRVAAPGVLLPGWRVYGRPVLVAAVEDAILRFSPAMLCQVYGPVFADVPEAQARLHSVPFDLVDMSILLQFGEDDNAVTM